MFINSNRTLVVLAIFALILTFGAQGWANGHSDDRNNWHHGGQYESSDSLPIEDVHLAHAGQSPELTTLGTARVPILSLVAKIKRHLSTFSGPELSSVPMESRC
jgi:hypothetical protein